MYLGKYRFFTLRLCKQSSLTESQVTQKVKVEPHHIFSLHQESRNNLVFLDEKTIIFPSGNNCVIYNVHKHVAKFIRGLMLYQHEQQGIRALAISPDRRYLAVSESGIQCTVSVYDLQSEECTSVQILMANGFSIQEFVCMAFSADSKYLLCQAGGPEWNLFYWEWEKDKLIAIVETTKLGFVNQVSFNPVDNTQICVSGSYVFSVFKLENDCLKKISMFSVDCECIKSHAWLSENSIVSGTKTGNLLLVKDEMLFSLTSPSERGITTITAYSKGFACTGSLGEVCIYEKTGEYGYTKTLVIKIPQDPCSSEPSVSAQQEVKSICLSPSEETLAISTRQGQIYHFNLASVENRQSKQANFEYLFHLIHSGSITDLSVCFFKPLFATCSKDNSVHIWNYKTNSLELHQQFPEEPNCISLHPNGLSILVGFSDKVLLMNLLVDQFRTVQEFDIHDCSECVFNHDGNLFATVSENLISIINFRTGGKVELKGHNGKVQSVKWREDSCYLVSNGLDGTVFEWNALTGARKSLKTQKSFSFTDMTFSASNKSIISVGDSMLKEFRDGEVLREITSVNETYTAISMTQSGQAVFVGTSAGILRVAQYPFEEEISWTELQAHSGPITKMVVTPGDQYLLTASEDGSLLIWSITDQDGCKLSMVKETCFTEEEEEEEEEKDEEVLCSKAFLEKKDQRVLEVRAQMELLKEEMDCKLNQTHMDYEIKLDKVRECFLKEIDDLKGIIRMLNTEMEEQKVSQKKALAETIEKHAEELKDQKKRFEKKLLKCYNNRLTMRQKYEQKLCEQDKNRFQTSMDMKRGYDQRLQQEQDKTRYAEEKLKELQEKVDSNFKDVFLQKDQELQAEKETNERLQDEMKLMEKQVMQFWKVKGEIQEQCLDLTRLEAKVMEINVKDKETIERLQQKIKKQEEELCTEKKQVRNMKALVQRMKADIKNCSSFVDQPHQLKANFIRLDKSYNHKPDMRFRVKSEVVQETRQREQLQSPAVSLEQKQAVESKTQQADCSKMLKQLMEFESEEAQKLVNKDSTAELAEFCLRYKQELQAAQETCSQLKYEIKLMEKQMVQFWKIKEEIQDQNLEINMLKEEVQSLHDQHMDGKKLRKEKEQKKPVQKQEVHFQDLVEMHKTSKTQNKADLKRINSQLDEIFKDSNKQMRQTAETNLEEVKNRIEEKKLFLKKLKSEVKEINSKNQETIHNLKEELKVKDNELCTERQRIKRLKALLDRIKADIQTCSDVIQQPKLLKESILKLHKSYIKEAEIIAMPTEEKNHRGRTRDSRTTKIHAPGSTSVRDSLKSGRSSVTLSKSPYMRSQTPKLDILKIMDLPPINTRNIQ
ncbi:cilia- and flagella-associated protein 57-like [Tachysurus vachellii]|uniref:cilia- and flagella-associated protein 57-like n=1 Tax=Tachysurus vachellii TaxID=175792 RepID=UPI00296AB7B8|nr:cilia- and flagella-associated protein 57-like [Tachysurus vachellii]